MIRFVNHDQIDQNNLKNVYVRKLFTWNWKVGDTGMQKTFRISDTDQTYVIVHDLQAHTYIGNKLIMWNLFLMLFLVRSKYWTITDCAVALFVALSNYNKKHFFFYFDYRE